MQTITAEDRQTLFDIALMVWGRAELAYDLAEANDLVLSDAVAAGTLLVIPTVGGKTDTAVADAYALNNIRPATAPTGEELAALAPEGISYWWVKEPAPFFVVSPNKNE